jgi:D-alanyl-D-alanine carboxypeptidase/D-alanyl-D-alanine-endopeptidase (penicillin-binding protein 4)
MPRPKKLIAPSDSLVAQANLTGKVGFAVADARTGELLEARLGDERMPPASTLKVVTALYAMDKLGPTHQFATRVFVTGPVVDGKLDGDLVLVGGGDPTLDTDRLADLAKAVREAGIIEVSGRLLVWANALPTGDRIDADQPEHVSYNPSYSGINLNYNRVHFEWKRRQDKQYDITMHARALRFSPATNVAQMAVVDKTTPVFDYRRAPGRDRWFVARRALGAEGARWLPVRFPALYAGDVFRTLARSNGIVLPAPVVVDALPAGEELSRVEGPILVEILRSMLKYSTNLTAEISGLSASSTYGPGLASLDVSAGRMAGWARSNFGTMGMRFRDHSGLGYGSAMSASDMVQILAANRQIRPFLKTVNLTLNQGRPAPKGVEVHAKTGTLNYVSSLAGFVTPTNGRPLCFAIFGADTERRDAIPPEARERPPGARNYSRRSRQLQKELIRGWVSRFT